MRHDASRADEQVSGEPDGNEVAGEAADDQPRVVDEDADVELAVSSTSLSEDVGDFRDAGVVRKMQQDVEEDLEPVRYEARRDPLDQVAPDHEEAAHRIGDDALEDGPGEHRSNAAEPMAGGAHSLVDGAA